MLILPFNWLLGLFLRTASDACRVLHDGKKTSNGYIVQYLFLDQHKIFGIWHRA
jgi:hypothetical protein